MSAAAQYGRAVKFQMGTVGPAVLSNRVNGKSNSTFKRPLGPTPDDTESSTSVSAVKIKKRRDRESII